MKVRFHDLPLTLSLSHAHSDALLSVIAPRSVISSTPCPALEEVAFDFGSVGSTGLDPSMRTYEIKLAGIEDWLSWKRASDVASA